MQEIWKDVKGFEGIYCVSNLGNVKSYSRMTVGGVRNRFVCGRLMKTKVNRGGYVVVHLRNIDKNVYPLVHRLVAEAFIPNYDNKPTVNHINGIKTDNAVVNLEWSTHSEQMIHAIGTGLYVQPDISKYTRFGENAHNCKVNDTEVEEIKSLRKTGLTYEKIGKIYGIGISQVFRICKGESRLVKTNEQANCNQSRQQETGDVS